MDFLRLSTPQGSISWNPPAPCVPVLQASLQLRKGQAEAIALAGQDDYAARQRLQVQRSERLAVIRQVRLLQETHTQPGLSRLTWHPGRGTRQ